MDGGDKITGAIYEANFGGVLDGVTINEGYNSNISDNVNLNFNANNVNVAPYKRDADQLMPASNVDKIMRNVLPKNAKISQDSKEVVQQCASEFISFITSEANDHCRREHRRTVTADDILYALSALGFQDYVHPLTRFLDRMREAERRSATMSIPSLGSATIPSAMQMQMHTQTQMQMQTQTQTQMQMQAPPQQGFGGTGDAFGGGGQGGSSSVSPSSFDYVFSTGNPPFQGGNPPF